MATSRGNVSETFLSNIFSLYNSSGKDTVTFNEMQKSLKNYKLLSSEGCSAGMQDIIGYTHNCLSSSKQRFEGLMLLNSIVNQCGTEVFLQNSSTWIKFLIQIVQGHCKASQYSDCCHILGQIVKFSRPFSDVSKEIVTTVIPQLLPLLLSASVEVRASALSCINDCIFTYPGPLGPFKPKIETLVLEELDAGASYQALHRCFALLARCGPGGTLGIKHTDAWTEQCDKLIGSLTATLINLYDGPDMESKNLKERECLSLSLIDHTRSDRITASCHRWSVLCNCMEALLSEQISSVAKVFADDILQLMFRCLSLNPIILLSKPTRERILLASLIPDIHISALSVIEKLIGLCKHSLLSHATIISEVLCKELIWSQTSGSENKVHYGLLRQQVYQVMIMWMKLLQGSSSTLMVAYTFVKHILTDCLPHTDTFKLTPVVSSSGSRKDEATKYNKKDHKGYREISHGISFQRKIDHQGKSELAATALDGLYSTYALPSTDSIGRSKNHLPPFCLVICPLADLNHVQPCPLPKDIHQFTISTLLKVQQSNEYCVPYGNVPCRLGLYRVLKACALLDHHAVPAPVQYVMRIFQLGTLDTSIEVSSMCIEALRMCEALIHPRMSSLNQPFVHDALVTDLNTACNSDSWRGVVSDQTSSVNTTSSSDGWQSGEMSTDQTSSEVTADEWSSKGDVVTVINLCSTSAEVTPELGLPKPKNLKSQQYPVESELPKPKRLKAEQDSINCVSPSVDMSGKRDMNIPLKPQLSLVTADHQNQKHERAEARLQACGDDRSTTSVPSTSIQVNNNVNNMTAPDIDVDLIDKDVNMKDKDVDLMMATFIDAGPDSD